MQGHTPFFVVGAHRLAVSVMECPGRVRLLQCLEEIGVEYDETLPPFEQSGSHTMHILCSRCLTVLSELPQPAVLVCTGASIPDEALLRLSGRRVPVLPLDRLTPERLLQAMMQVAGLGSANELARRLCSKFPSLPIRLVEAFVAYPRDMNRLTDICRALGASRALARRLVQEAGHHRAEHLLTALRTEAWLWFSETGTDRRTFERYLGIWNRGSFRRSCSRAGTDTPWGGVR